MKTRKPVLFLVVIGLIFIGSLTYAKKLISINDAMKKYEGVWINEEYTGEKVTQPQKFVITADGGVEDWALATQASPTFRGNHKVVESWIDRRRLHLLHS
jgi:hypothetical protein